MTMYFRILSGKDGGSGSFLCPPGHPALTHSLYGWNSKAVATRYGTSKASYIGSVESALEPDAWPEMAAIVGEVQRLFDAATLVCSEAWVRSVYGYFRNSYSPDGDRSVARSVRSGPPELHLGFLCVREYFPGHEPRLDLIASPGRGAATANYPCDKCGERVQYEARIDGWSVYDRNDGTCPQGGKHEVAP